MGWAMMYLELTNIRANTNFNTIVFICDEIITIEILYVNCIINENYCNEIIHIDVSNTMLLTTLFSMNTVLLLYTICVHK